jgi:mannosyltransferase OCH1-like enzyme
MELIPKIIHQIWIGEKPPPYIWINTWKNDYIKTFPEYQYVLWDNEKCEKLLNKYPKLQTLYYTEVEYCGKADIVRYVILYEYGGIYIDADSAWINEKCLSSLIDNVNDSGVFASLHNDIPVLANGVFGCTTNNSSMKKILDELQKYTSRSYRRKRNILGVSRVTGHGIFDKLRNDNITIYPVHYFYPISWFGINDPQLHKKMELPEDSYMFQYGLTSNKLDYENLN